MPLLPKELILLRNLHELTTPPATSGSLPREQREAAFRAYNIDPSKTASELKLRIGKLIGARRLQAAQIARHEAQSAHKKHSEALAHAGESLRAHVERLLARLSLNQPDLAAVYCRKYEHATERDLASLKEDLLLLDQLEKEGGEDDGKSA